MATITLLSDFGLTDPYLAEMKGVILSVDPHLNIVDVSHGVERHNIAMGSFILETALPHFPPGSIHVAVVDPGVGTERLSLVVDCKSGILVGPDNGLLVRASERLGFKGAYQIDSRRFGEVPISSTFHGRDIFARTAAILARGLKPNAVGSRVKRLVRLDIPTVSIARGRANCTVLYVDSFGNVILNLTHEDIARLRLHSGDRITIRTPKRRAPGLLVKTYSDIPHSRLAMIRGSQGYLEIAMREDSAAAKLGLQPLDHLVIGFN